MDPADSGADTRDYELCDSYHLPLRYASFNISG